MRFRSRILSRFARASLLLLAPALAARAQTINQFQFIPPVSLTNTGSLTAQFQLTGFTAPITVIFQRRCPNSQPPISTNCNGATDTRTFPANGTSQIPLVLSDIGPADNQSVTWDVVAQDSAVPQNVRFVASALTVTLDNVAPNPPVTLSPAFPATAFGNALTVSGTVTDPGSPPTTPLHLETGGVVLVESSSPLPITTIGAGAILSNGNFTATVDLSSLTTGVATQLIFIATDQAGNISGQRVVTVTKQVAPPPTLTAVTMQPPDGSLTNNPAVLVRGTVNGQVPPLTVDFFVDGLLDSQVAGLTAGQQFAHTLDLPNDGLHVISVQATNASVTPNPATAQRVGVITLDTKPPGPPTIITPSPTGPTTLTSGTPFTITGVSSERAFCTTSPACPRPKILLSGPGGVVFNPVSPITPNDQTGQFTTQVNVSAVADGQGIITVTSVDAAGNTSSGASAQVLFIKDSAPPKILQVKVNGVVAPQINPEIYVGLATVTIELDVDKDMLTPPNLTAAQAGGTPVAVPFSTSSNFRAFTYIFFPQRNADGPVDLTFKGGADRFAVPMDPTLTRVFIVDTTPPTVVSVSPANNTTTNQTPSPIQVVFNDPLSAAQTASGVDLTKSSITLTGPLGASQANIKGTTAPFNPTTLDFTPNAKLPSDGLYRITVVPIDKVGNQGNPFISTFTFDTTPINPAEEVCNPPDGAFVNPKTIPGTSATPFVESTVNDPQFSAATSLIELDDFCRTPPKVPGTQSTQTPNRIRYTLNGPLATDGSQDGKYAIGVTIRDSAGNTTPQTFCTFTYDSIPPATDRTFPAAGQFINGALRAVDATVFDPIPDACRAASGIDRTKTTLRLFLLTPNTATNKKTAGEKTGILRFISVGNLDRVLLEIVDQNNVPVGLANDGTDDGVYQLQVQPVDKAGNQGVITTAAFTYDTLPPALTVNNLASGVTITGPQFTITGNTKDNAGGSDILKVTGSLFSSNPDGSLTTPTPIFQDVLGTLIPPVPPLDGSPPRRNFTFTGDLSQLTSPIVGRLVISSFDKAGNFRDQSFIVNVSPNPLQPPLLSQPASGSATDTGLVAFTWRGVAGAFDYRLTIRTPKGNQIVKTSNGATSLKVNLSLLGDGDGRYQWSVAALDAAGNAGTASPNFVFDLITTAPTVIALDILDPSPEGRGVVNAGEVRFQITFSHDMDTTHDLTAQIVPELGSNLPLPVKTLSFQQNLWIGTATIPENNGQNPDYNGLVELAVTGGVDRAGNPMLPPNHALTVFEIDTGPSLQIAFFQNPVDNRDLVLVLKGLTQPGGGPTTVVESPTVTLSQLNESDQSPPVYRNNDASFRMTFHVDLANPAPITLAATARDQRGNSATRTFTLNVFPSTTGQGGVVEAAAGSLTLSVPAQGRGQSRTVLAIPARIAAPPTAAPLPAELTRVADLDQFGPVGLAFAKPARLRLDLARLARPAHPELVGKGRLYGWNGEAWEFLPQTVAGGRLEAQMGAVMPVALLADSAPPRVTITSPGVDGKLDPLHPVIEADLTDQGAGVDGGSITATVDGRPAQVHFDAASGHLTADPPRMSQGDGHTVVVSAADRAGNRVTLSHKLTAPAPLGFSELVGVPNPANVVSHIRYNLTQSADSVTFTIYNVTGRTVRTIEGTPAAGVQTADWFLDDSHGGQVASGIYIVRAAVQSGGQRITQTAKIAVIR